MKRIVFCLLASVALAACEKPDGNPDGWHYWPDSLGECRVFVDATLGKEKIILARSWIQQEELSAIYDSLKSVYGEGVFRVSGQTYIWGLDPYSPEAQPGGIDCYEKTDTFEFFDESNMPSGDDLHDFCAVRINGRTITCKDYFWAPTEEFAETVRRNSEGGRYWTSGPTNDNTNPNRPVIGVRVGRVTVKKLGRELYNVPIEF